MSIERVSLAQSRAGYQPGQSEAPDESPKPLAGKALDEALKAVGLPTTGKAGEKRALLASHMAESNEAPPQPPADTPPADSTNPDGGTPASKPEEG